MTEEERDRRAEELTETETEGGFGSVWDLLPNQLDLGFGSLNARRDGPGGNFATIDEDGTTRRNRPGERTSRENDAARGERQARQAAASIDQRVEITVDPTDSQAVKDEIDRKIEQAISEFEQQFTGGF